MLEKSFLFRNKCKNSDSKLRRHIRLVNAGKGLFWHLKCSQRDQGLKFDCFVSSFSLLTVSHVFDDSDDEYEDDYTESLKLISELSKKIQHRRKLNAASNVPIVTVAAEQAAAEQAAQVLPGKSKAAAREIPLKLENIILSPELSQAASNSAVRTRTPNRSRNLPAENKISERSIIYDANGQTIEVLVEDIGGGGGGGGGGDDEQDETEYIIADAIENAFEGPFQPTDSNDEEFDALIANSENQFDNEEFSLQEIAKNEDLYVSEESVDAQKSLDDYVDVDDEVDDEIDEGNLFKPFHFHHNAQRKKTFDPYLIRLQIVRTMKTDRFWSQFYQPSNNRLQLKMVQCLTTKRNIKLCVPMAMRLKYNALRPMERNLKWK